MLHDVLMLSSVQAVRQSDSSLCEEWRARLQVAWHKRTWLCTSLPHAHSSMACHAAGATQNLNVTMLTHIHVAIAGEGCTIYLCCTLAEDMHMLDSVKLSI